MTIEKTIPLLEGLREISKQYEGYILDLWGTVHNGVEPYRGVITCLDHLKERGRRVVFLSNAPRRSSVVARQLTAFGIKPSHYDGLITSGEIAYQLMQGGADNQLGTPGRRMLVIGGLHDLTLYEGLDLHVVHKAADADFVLNTGPDEQRGTHAIEPYLPELQECLARNLPMICPNPDRVVMKGQQRQICAGALAEYYQRHGGHVMEVGKPFPLVYEATMNVLGTAKGQTLAVGDSLATDIKGATNFGIDSLWLLGGIHQELLRNDEEELLRVCHAAHVRPRAVMRSLMW